MRFEEITLSTLVDKFGHVDGLADIWCKILKLKSLWKLYKNDGRIGPVLQCHFDELVSGLEQILLAPEPSKLFQAMLDGAPGAAAIATQFAGMYSSEPSTAFLISAECLPK